MINYLKEKEEYIYVRKWCIQDANMVFVYDQHLCLLRRATTLEGPKGGRADWGVDKAVDICKSGFCSSENILISDFIQGIITSFIDFLFFFLSI